MFDFSLLATIGVWSLFSGLWWILQRQVLRIGVSKSVVMFVSGVGSGGLIVWSLVSHGWPALSAGVMGLFALHLVLEVAIAYGLVSAAEKTDASVAVGVTAFAPVVAIGTGYLLLREVPGWLESLGIIVIMLGTYVLHMSSSLKAGGWRAPFQAVWRNRGSWLKYAVLIAFLSGLIFPITKQLVLATNNFFAVGVSQFLGWGIFWGAWAWHKQEFRTLAAVPRKSMLAGFLLMLGVTFALANAGQGAAFYFGLAASVGALKRLDGPVTVLLAWLILKEGDIRYRLPGTILIALGVVLIGLG